MVAAHARFLALALWEARSDFADVQLNCKDGVLHLNRLLFGLILPCLGSLEEFNSCLAEVVIVLPHSCVEEITRAVEELLSGVQDCEVEAECEVEILMEGEGKQAAMEEKLRTDQLTIHKANELSSEAVVDTDAVNVDHNPRNQVLAIKVEESENKGGLSDVKPNTCDLSVMGGVKSNNSQNSDAPNLRMEQTSLPSIHPVNSQPNQPSNLTYPPNSTGPVQPRLQQAGLKPHRCSSCGKGFVSRSNMRAHMRLHEGTALRYQCPHCEKKFSHPSEVKQHQVVHTGIRAYCCSRCGNRYSRYPSLWKHKRKCQLLPKSELLLVRPTSGALLVKQNKTVLVDGSMEGTLVVDEIVITDGIKNTNHSNAFPVHSFSIQTSA